MKIGRKLKMFEYKITKIIEAGLYTKDGEKVMDLTNICRSHLLGEIIICKKDNSDNTEIEFKND